MSARKDLAPQFADLQQRLGAGGGKKYWRTLEELADSPAFQELLRDEFPEQAAEWERPLSRRQFLTLMGASLALAGVSGCSTRPAPSTDIVPYVRAPEEIIPGRPLFYATVMALGGAGVGLLVESHLGRPTKAEGNPEHPASLGATDVYHQASVLTLYDPDRSQTVTLLGQTSTWDAALGRLPVGKTPSLTVAVNAQRQRRGAGLRILSESIVSPTLGRQMQDFQKAFPEAKWHLYEPLGRDMARRGSHLAFGEYVDAVYDFKKADIVLSLDCDFLACGPASLRYTADFMSRRRVRNDDAAKARMNRLYVVETAVTCTGAKADHRLALPGQEIERVARALAARLGVKEAGAAEREAQEKWVASVAKDLDNHRGRCVVLAGDRQPPAVHLLAHVLNLRLGNVGRTVTYTECVEARPADHTASLRELVEDMDRGKVEALVILGGNPVYTAPADFHFTESMQKVPLRAHLSLYQDETSRQCHWHLPEAHYLEAWGDARAYDGTASVAQPLILPLYHGRSAHELMSSITDGRQAPRLLAAALGGAGQFRVVRDVLADGAARRRHPRHRVRAAEGEPGRRLGEGPANAGERAGRRAGVGAGVPAGPDGIRWPLRQQRLVAGTARADHAPDVGQRGDHESRDGEAARRLVRRLRPRRRARRLRDVARRVGSRGPQAGAARLDHAGPRRPRHHRLARLRP
jgi:molybdopterin-containing oxidoreductase family iron-sulfur binding subunit